MHASSLENMFKCFNRYVDCEKFQEYKNISIVDIGGTDVNGSYKDIFSDSVFDYKVMDISSGENVDIVLEDPYKFPLPDNSVDIIISGQTLEHVEFFWLLLKEMVRVLDEKGLIFLIVPSGGPEHRYPVDCYRFYPDSLSAMAKYTDSYLIDYWLDVRGPWNDLVGILSKSRYPEYRYRQNKEKFFKSIYQDCLSPKFFTGTAVDSLEKIEGSEYYLDSLKLIHNILNPEFYFEIGVREGDSLALSTAPAIAVDPEPAAELLLNQNCQLFKMTSDDFFEWFAREKLIQKIDLAFIDGMHLFEFALRDFINVEKYSTRNSVIVIDDILPNHRVQAQRERQSNVWMGDVWKIRLCLKQYRPDLKLLLLDTRPSGMLLITGLNPGSTVLNSNYNPVVREYKNLDIIEYEEEIFNRKNCKRLTEDLLNEFRSSSF